jgi:hypothetical protein
MMPSAAMAYPSFFMLSSLLNYLRGLNGACAGTFRRGPKRFLNNRSETWPASRDARYSTIA